jgi:hypothetical protein
MRVHTEMWRYMEMTAKCHLPMLINTLGCQRTRMPVHGHGTVLQSGWGAGVGIEELLSTNSASAEEHPHCALAAGHARRTADSYYGALRTLSTRR